MARPGLEIMNPIAYINFDMVVDLFSSLHKNFLTEKQTTMTNVTDISTLSVFCTLE